MIENYQISYLTAGRDLIKQQTDAPSQQDPVIFAHPNYESAATSAQPVTSESSRRSVDTQSLKFNPLAATAEEAAAIAPLLSNAVVYTDNQATENSLKQVNAPSILHIATHGFFLPDVPFVVPDNSDSRRAAAFEVAPLQVENQIAPNNLENPLLRSGLALAGVNSRSSGGEDGIFTALEASSLDLQGTQLVVLSACETGVGAASSGEGVYGLRRAFAVAGTESQIMSLWQVDDYGTSALMKLFYENLATKGQGRSEALRNAQLEMLNSKGVYSDPYYWSSFIFSGDWRPLQSGHTDSL